MAKELKTSEGGRNCKFPHCKHLLSIYNHEDYCHVHRNQVGILYNLKTTDVQHPKLINSSSTLLNRISILTNRSKENLYQ